MKKIKLSIIATNIFWWTTCAISGIMFVIVFIGMMCGYNSLTEMFCN